VEIIQIVRCKTTLLAFHQASSEICNDLFDLCPKLSLEKFVMFRRGLTSGQQHQQQRRQQQQNENYVTKLEIVYFCYYYNTRIFPKLNNIP
jgi:hypothetical protein